MISGEPRCRAISHAIAWLNYSLGKTCSELNDECLTLTDLCEKTSSAMSRNQDRRRQETMWNFSGLSMRMCETDVPVEMGMQLCLISYLSLPKHLRKERSPHLLGMEQVWNTGGLIPGFLGWKGKIWDIPLAAEEFTWICPARLQRQQTLVIQHQACCSSLWNGTASREHWQKKG